MLSAEEVPTREATTRVSEPRAVRRASCSTSACATIARRATFAGEPRSTTQTGCKQAARLFARHDSLEAKIGAAFAAWPGSLDRVEQLGALYPRSALAQLHLGLARFWAGEAGAVEAWREARDVEPDTLYAVRASDLLHPDVRTGACPCSCRRRRSRAGLEQLTPAQQLETLRAAAARGGLDARLQYGVALQRLGRPVSAQRVYDEAARAFPDEPEALVGVGRRPLHEGAPCGRDSRAWGR